MQIHKPWLSSIIILFCSCLQILMIFVLLSLSFLISGKILVEKKYNLNPAFLVNRHKDIVSQTIWNLDSRPDTSSAAQLNYLLLVVTTHRTQTLYNTFILPFSFGKQWIFFYALFLQYVFSVQACIQRPMGLLETNFMIRRCTLKPRHLAKHSSILMIRGLLRKWNGGKR